MIYIVCALFIEAKPFIKYYKLKRDMSDNFYQVFNNDDVYLIVSGSGKVSSACAVSHILSRGISNDDFIVNVGLCGSSVHESGNIFLVNKIIDNSTKREFFPDMLIRSGFKEEYVETFERPVVGGDYNGLCDMEASGFFQAASKFMPPHAVHVIKIVSDNLKSRIDADDAEKAIEDRTGDIDIYLNKLKQIMRHDDFFKDFEYEEINAVIEKLKLTESCRVILKNSVVSYKLRHGSLPEMKNIICGKVKTKNESKEKFKRLIGLLSQ